MIFVLRVVAWIAATVVVLGGLYFGVGLLASAQFNPDPPQANYSKPRDALEAQRQDLDYFRKLIGLDRAFSPAARAEAERRIVALERGTVALERHRLRAELSRIMALADNGHTSMFAGDNGGRPNLLPIRVFPFADGLYVLRAQAAHADLLGLRVDAIDGHPVEDVLARLAELRGGIPAFRRSYAALFVTSPGMLYGVGIAATPERSRWRFVAADGTAVERDLAAYQPADLEPFAPSGLWLSARRFEHEPEGWRPLVADEARLPLTLRDFNRIFRRVWVDGTCVLLISMKAIQDESGESIDDFLAATEADMRARPPCAVILDQRFNGGGDYTNVWTFSKRLPELIAPTGKIYILTTADTFSAAISMTGFIKEAGGGGGVILGEPVGDRMAFWSEGGSGCLPNTKLCAHYSTGKHDYANPCRDWDTCYWVNWFYPIRVTGFGPDETIRMRFADYTAGRDPVFDRAVQLATARR
jgi:hypothetical protein